jgi:hypothetical protein
MNQTWTDSFVVSFRDIWAGVADFIPTFVGAIVLFIVGVLVAGIVGKAIEQIFKVAKLDALLSKIGAERYLSRAGIALNSPYFLGELVKWFFVVIVLVQSLTILKLFAVTAFLKSILNFLPNVFIATFVLITGLLLGDFVDRVVTGASKMVNLAKSKMLGTAARTAIWVFAVLVALYHLGIGAVFSELVFTGIVTALALAFGLAFGLGGVEHASEFIANIKKDIKDRA